jgi:hypothetical protein
MIFLPTKILVKRSNVTFFFIAILNFSFFVVTFRFGKISFRFVSFRFDRFRFVSFGFVSFLFRFALYRYPSKVCPVSVNVTKINVLSNLRTKITNKKSVKSIMLYKNNLHNLYFLNETDRNETKRNETKFFQNEM